MECAVGTPAFNQPVGIAIPISHGSQDERLRFADAELGDAREQLSTGLVGQQRGGCIDPGQTQGRCLSKLRIRCGVNDIRHPHHTQASRGDSDGTRCRPCPDMPDPLPKAVGCSL